ncbi:ABC transporter ATP-binding protein [Protaetiibacter mangrovi]|uniref:ABC transporter ATP-binding protein n=1 Tax=Protaetiibacter mangrovi TaxID=2970926 RepID=A0ABT1ZGI5_9MICO|nr:ABC transporter ATP-binding protein [Protaetiibacter mangrovi]MCS0499824.1 ABC transporter ATP-binding protein [Protaetiibacter mangrovi]TPX02958.1 ABC transporter ATP-binding protein [Schumannella luteola]
MLRIDNLRKTFDVPSDQRGRGRATASAQLAAIDDVSLEIHEGEMFTFLGPSGCGKTTTLRSIAGLERPDSGEIRLSERVLFSRGRGRDREVPVNRRGLGMVFQSYAIWPHLSVFDNVAFPLQVMPRRDRPKKKVIEERVMRVLATMELDAFAGRSATKLSGGQQQRLALARALVTEPPLLLLDEPLSNLDAKLRESLRFELKRLQHEIGITSIYVTHDQVEALALSSRIAVMSKGQVAQVGAPRDIYTHPESKFVAEFIGNSNFLPATAVESGNGTAIVETPQGRLEVAVDRPLDATASYLIGIRPESVEVLAAETAPAAGNGFSGTVAARSYLGEAVDHIVDIGGYEMRARVNPSVSFPAGTAVRLRIDPATISLIPTEGASR